MSNLNLFVKAFSDALKIEEPLIQDTLAYNSIGEWDSIAHMTLITNLEDAFEIMLDTSDIIDMNSVGKAKEILSKHGVAI